MIQIRSSALAALVCFALCGALNGCDAQLDAAGSSPVAKSGCLGCHATGKASLIAPPFASISQRYSSNPAAAAALAESLKNGTHGKWAEYPGGAMPPQSQLSESEAKALVQWILNQK
jgi:cytochrome c